MKKTEFPAGVAKKSLVVQFDGGKITSDAGALLLKQLDDKLRLTERINSLFADPRDPI